MNVVITGASKGIGYAVVKRMAAGPTNNVIAISRNADSLMQLQHDCDETYGYRNVFPVSFDLSESYPLFNQFFADVKARFSHVDVLINNAGHLANKPFMDASVEEMEKSFIVNVFGPAKLIKTLYPLMGKSGSSHIVNIGSMGGFQGSAKYTGLAFYSASKAALASLTECLAGEFKDDKIIVNCLALGAVQTEMLSAAFPGYKAPLEADKMAGFIADFAMNGHHFFNGKILPVALSNPS